MLHCGLYGSGQAAQFIPGHSETSVFRVRLLVWLTGGFFSKLHEKRGGKNCRFHIKYHEYQVKPVLAAKVSVQVEPDGGNAS